MTNQTKQKLLGFLWFKGKVEGIHKNRKKKKICGGIIRAYGSKECRKGKMDFFPLCLNFREKTQEFYNLLGTPLQIPTHEERD